ncbi:Xaa-Pro peptidase family protein [Halobacillus sp. Marseille-Q1614]|uniref:M24 family metallopeptidase n=1 Tax=Halobacillus sp. Marseille-Q1614 TaxID=2709134 RepID=UPI00156E9E7F|nr:aminopeptidase P family protein [Halobacillus sp. Marseille-Q1614]
MQIQKVREFMEGNNFDGLLLRKRNNFSWLTGGNYNHIVQTTELGVADLLITAEEVYLITSKMEERRVFEEECSQLPYQVEVLSDDWYEDIEKIIHQAGEGKRMATDTPFSDWEVVDEDLMKIRSVLSEQEQANYRDLCQRAAHAVEETCREVEPGQTEYEVEAHLASKVLAQGIRIQVILVATDERIFKYRHPIPTNKPLEKQAMIVLCAERNGLVANVTRFVHFGELSDEIKAHKEKAARIDAAMNAATKPGNTAGDVIRAGIKQYEEEGFPNDWKLLHQGGLTGYSSREFLADPHTEFVIKENQAYAWNPSLPGVKSEDTVLVKGNGIEFITHTNNWVYQDITVGQQKYQRPDILIR